MFTTPDGNVSTKVSALCLQTRASSYNTLENAS